MGISKDTRDFFISYNSADKAYADAINEALIAAGFTTHYAPKDCLPGTNVPNWMEMALTNSVQVLGLCSPEYFSDKAEYSQMERMAAIWGDPTGKERRLVPVELRSAKYRSLIAPLARITSTSGKTADAAAKALIMELKASKQVTTRVKLKTVNPQPDICKIGRPRLLTFTGHEKQLEELHQQLSSGHRAAVTQAIAGMGGIGKTTLAAEYAHRYGTRASYAGVWWINAEAGAQQGLAELSGRIDELAGLGNASIPDQAKAVLEYLSAQTEPWLLIYDNVENPDAIRDWLPGGTVRMIITSRYNNWDGLADKTPLAVWDEAVTTDYLLETTGRTDRDGAKKLAKLLDGLPLAADQAAAFLRRRPRVAFKAYANKISQRIADERRSGNKGPYPFSVYATLVNSIETLSEPAKDLLSLLSWLSPEGVDLELLLCDLTEEPHILPASFCEVLADDDQCDDMIEDAASLSLLGTSGEGEAVSLIVHRITQAVLRRWQSITNRDGWDVKATHLISALFPAYASDIPSAWPLCRKLLLHAQTLAEVGPKEGDGGKALIYVLNEAGIYIASVRGDTHEAIRLLEPNTALTKSIFGARSEHYTAALANLSGMYSDLGRYKEAEQAFKEVLEIGEVELGPDHPKIAIRLNNLGEVYWKQKQFDKAEPLLKRALEIGEGPTNDGSFEVADVMNALGALYDNWAEMPGEEHRRDNAKELKEKTVATARKSRGERHPQVSIFLHNLAFLYDRLGDCTEAARLESRSTAILLSLWGFENPESRENLNQLMYFLGKAAQFVPAEKMGAFLFAEILMVEKEMEAWVKEDSENRHFGPPSYFADEAELLDALKAEIEKEV